MIQYICETAYQSPWAEQDHEDDEGLEPAVLHDLVAGLPQPPPDLAQPSAGVHLAAGAVPHTDWGGRTTHSTVRAHVKPSD